MGDCSNLPPFVEGVGTKYLRTGRVNSMSNELYDQYKVKMNKTNEKYRNGKSKIQVPEWKVNLWQMNMNQSTDQYRNGKSFLAIGNVLDE